MTRARPKKTMTLKMSDDEETERVGEDENE